MSCIHSYKESNNLEALDADVRALIVYDLFNGQVSNGGVMQYFFNLAPFYSDFQHFYHYASHLPELKSGFVFMQEAHEAYEAVLPRVIAAREKAPNEWPEDLFKDDLFEALEEGFYAIHNGLRMSLEHLVLSDPERFFTLKDHPDIKESIDLRADIKQMNGTIPNKNPHKTKHYSLRFMEAFPIGPNIIESADHTHQTTILFSKDRTHVDILGYINPWGEPDEYENLSFDYRAQHHLERSFKQGQLQNIRLQGLSAAGLEINEDFHCDGKSDYTTINIKEKEYYHASYWPNGNLKSEKTTLDDGTVSFKEFFDNDQLNVAGKLDGDIFSIGHAIKYTACFDKEGNNLLSDGSGELRELLFHGVSECHGGRVIERWRKGKITNGYPVGKVLHDTDGKVDESYTYGDQGVLTAMEENEP